MSVRKLNSPKYNLLADILDIPEITTGTESLQNLLNNAENNHEIEEYFVDRNIRSFDENIIATELTDSINKTLNCLNPREKDIIRMRFGLNNDGEKETLDKVSLRFGISRERTRQIENKALCKLKRACRLCPEIKELNLKQFLYD